VTIFRLGRIINYKTRDPTRIIKSWAVLVKGQRNFLLHLFFQIVPSNTVCQLTKTSLTLLLFGRTVFKAVVV